MKGLEREYRGFADPLEHFNDDFLELVTVAHAKEVTRRFLDRFAARLRKDSDGLSSALGRWLAASATFEDVWDTAFGRLRLCMKDQAAGDVVRSAAAAALRIAERGGAAHWEVRFDRPTRLRVGRIVLPVADRLGASADGRRLELQVSRGRRTTRRTLPQPVPYGTDANGLDTLAITNAEGARFVILRREAWDVKSSAEDVRLDPAPDSIVRPLEAALRLIAKYSPPYLSWISRVVRQVLPLQDNLSMMTSSTAAWRPGLIYSANRPDPAALAEMLVHEGTHQYMYILHRLGPLDDGSDQNLYYSPVSRKMRPLGVIVLAYHAVANITLFCRACPSGSRLRPRQTEKTFVGALDTYEDILRRSRSLTAVGAALWQPLYERLHAEGAGTFIAAHSQRAARRDASGIHGSTTARRPKERRTSSSTARPPHRTARMLSRAPAVC